MSNSALDELAVAKKWVCKLFILILFYTCKCIFRMGTPCSCAWVMEHSWWVFHEKEGGIQVGSGGIHLGINYSVSNETKRDE